MFVAPERNAVLRNEDSTFATSATRGEASLHAPLVCLGDGNLNRLVSLWDMVELLASTLARIPEDLVCIWADYLNDEKPDMIESTISVKRTIVLCHQIGWRDIASQGERLLSKMIAQPSTDPKEMKALANDFHQAVQHKFKELRIAAVEDKDSALFNNASAELCGGPLHEMLAISEEELNLAGRALALGLSTASVSHAMRSIEASLHLIGNVLGIPFKMPIELVEWSTLTQKIDAEIKVWDSKPRSEAKTAQLTQLGELLMPANGFRLAWRNHVAHAREKYEDPQARRVLQHAGEFLARVSAAL